LRKPAWCRRESEQRAKSQIALCFAETSQHRQKSVVNVATIGSMVVWLSATRATCLTPELAQRTGQHKAW
jgi:hypothetical protein